MHMVLSRWHFYHHGLAVGTIVVLLALAFACPVMSPALCSGGQQPCQSHTCELLVSGPTMAVLLVFAGLWWAARFPLLREHPLLLFRPPRLYLP
jgi:hypothetical protein